MSNAIWLFLALPSWYFPTILSPFSASYLSAIPASGIIALPIGAVLAGLHQERRVYWGFLSIALSHLLVTVAGLMRGGLEQPGGLLLTFLVIQFALLTAIAFKSRKSHLAAILIGWFCFSYALFAAFIAAMALPDSWL